MRSNSTPTILLSEIHALPLERKEQLQVSSCSKYRDIHWDFTKEIPNKNIRDSKKIIRWDKVIFHDGSKLVDIQHAQLLQSAKDSIFALLPYSGTETESVKHSTIITSITYLKKLLIWMVDNKFNKFSQLDKNACNRYVAYLNTLPIAKSSMCQALNILIRLYRQKSQINDAIIYHPFSYESTHSIAAYDQADQEKNKTLRIPEEVLMSLIKKALEYVEIKGFSLIEVQRHYEQVLCKAKDLSKHFQQKNRARFVKEKGYANVHRFNKEIRHLMAACYILIAFFSGMRDSETSSITSGCLRKKMLIKSNQVIYRIRALTFKTVDQPTLGYWMVPEVVKTAVDVLSLLTLPLRKTSGLRELFLYQYDGKVSILSNAVINDSMNAFARDNKVALHKGCYWHLHTHQFRKSFGYYMMKENKCNLKFLQNQFKHLSMDMTIWYAETDDDELKQEVFEMSTDVTREILRPILLGEVSLAGKGGEHIAKNRSTYFNGRTMRKKESLFREITEGLYVRGTYLGLCVWNPEEMKCEAGFECRCNPNTCKNAVVTWEHLPIWLRLKERHERLLAQPDIEPMKKQFLQTQLETFVMPILKKFEKQKLLSVGR